MEPVIFYILLFLVAFLYASVGHGGASGYLSLMAIFSMSPAIMKPTALLLNLFVSLTAFIQFARGGHFNFRMFLPFAIGSIPLAFVGGMMEVESSVYKKILGVVLLIPIARFLFLSKPKVAEPGNVNIFLALVIGMAIGYLSGLIGIGGGIILSPLLLLLGWTDLKQTAAISALFIFVNSLSGLAGQMITGIQFTPDMLTYVVIAFLGGLAGAYCGSLRFDLRVLNYLLVLVLGIAVYKLLFTQA